tara:strand:- start:5397 stop:5780 length:384 start_codon:yes stop_codon:yes gene_type:complete
MKEKYLYFRTDAAIGDDDGTGNSVCFPLSSFAGAIPTADSTLTLFFKSMLNYDGDADGANEVVISDSVQLTLASANTHKATLEALISFFGSTRDGMLIIGDDSSGKLEYFSPLISAVGTIAVAAINS